MMAHYTWAQGVQPPVSADIVGPILDDIDLNYGAIRPARVVEMARPDTAPLHKCFEWDNAAAAERHREDQARHLIRSIRVVRDPTANEPPKRIYVSVRHGDPQGYMAMERAMQSPRLRDHIMADALRQLQAWQARYKEIAQFAPVMQAITQVVTSTQGATV
jgi:hypothetical protein